MKKSITFKTETRKVSDLKGCDYNPRKISEKELKDLKKSFDNFGYVEICVVNTDNTIIAGHQRIKVMLELGWQDKEIEVRVPNRKLTKKEFDEYLLRSNENGGSYDYDILKENFDMDFLEMSGFDRGFLEEKFDFEEEEYEPCNETTEYEPNINPKIESKSMTEEQIEKTRSNMNTSITETKKTISVICPECGEEFGIDG